MVAGSILPVAIHKGQLYFLFGKENPLENSAKGFSDFGGGVEAGESPYQTAMREGAEELTGFLGNADELEDLIKKNGGCMPLVCGEGAREYNIHLFRYDYDPHLPEYYNRNHRFLWDKMDNDLLNQSKLFEKIEIAWMTPSEMRRRRSEFRPFYQAMVDRILGEIPNIRDFLTKINRKTRKTQKRK